MKDSLNLYVRHTVRKLDYLPTVPPYKSLLESAILIYQEFFFDFGKKLFWSKKLDFFISPVTVAEKRAILRTFWGMSKLFRLPAEIVYFDLKKIVYRFKKCAPPFKPPRRGGLPPLTFCAKNSHITQWYKKTKSAITPEET